MIRLVPLILLAGCGTIEMPAPIAYTAACPLGDRRCELNQTAQTLAYIGQSFAATKLMCNDEDAKNALGDECGEPQF